MPSGAGIAATNLPKAAGVSDQISTRDLGALAGADAQQAGLARRRVRQRVEPVIARWSRASRTNSAPSVHQLAVERQAGEMRADDREFDAVAQRRRHGRRRRRPAGRAHRRAGERPGARAARPAIKPSAPARAISVTLEGSPSPRTPEG